MPITETDIQLIEKHLEKTLSNTEQTAFDERLVDSDFVDELQLYQKSIFAIQAAGDKKLKTLLQLEEVASNAPPQYQNELFIFKIPSKWMKWQWMALAATFLIGAVTLLFVLNQPKTILATYFEHYNIKAYDGTRGDDSEGVETDLDRAYSAYTQKHYDKALAYFGKVTTLDSNALFIQSIAYLATHQIDKAIPILEKISQNTNAKQRQEAEWYLALALSEAQPEKAISLFEKIKSDTHNLHQKKAAAILNQLQ